MPNHDLLDLCDTWAPVFKLLADPSRLRLLATMHHLGPAQATVTELAEATGLRTATASAALNLLANAGYIEPHRTGREIRYALVEDRAHDLLHFIGAGHEH